MKILLFNLGPLRLGALNCVPKLEDFSDELESLLPQQELELANCYKNRLRKNEFLLGRYILHSLQADLPAILRAEKGNPSWPQGFVGSISHKDGHVVACLESNQDLFSVGIDLEETTRMPLEIAKQICLPEELRLLSEESTVDAKKELLSLIFSAKEALFKCCFPPSQIWFGFDEAVLSKFSRDEETFSIILLRDLPPFFVKGQIFNGLTRKINYGERQFLLASLWIYNHA